MVIFLGFLNLKEKVKLLPDVLMTPVFSDDVIVVCMFILPSLVKMWLCSSLKQHAAKVQSNLFSLRCKV